MANADKYLGALVEFLDHNRLRSGLVVREQGERVALLCADGRERVVPGDLVMLRHAQRKPDGDPRERLAALDEERARLGADLDLHLLWEVVREQGRSFSAPALAELFFGVSSTTATAAVLEALLNDRLYFVRRHMEFVPQSQEQFEKLRLQQERTRLRSEDSRATQALIRQLIGGGPVGRGAVSPALVGELQRYLDNPATRSRELTAMLTAAAPELSPTEVAFELLDRVGAAPSRPRFAAIGGLHAEFPAAVFEEARAAVPAPRALGNDGFAITVDDPETLEIDDALICEALPDGGMRVRIAIALVADFVAKGGALDAEAASRAATVYLPETTIRMLPDVISCDRASLIAGEERPALVTDVRLSEEGELRDSSIYPAAIRVARRLDYEQANEFIDGNGDGEADRAVRKLYAMAMRLRERRRRSGAALFQRREAKVKVQGEQIEVTAVDAHSPSRQMVAEFMVLSNFVAARFAAQNRLPIIYRVQPGSADFAMQRPRLSLYPEFHAGIGLDYYAQASSPIRRYADLVLQRQLIAGPGVAAYGTDQLMQVLANAESSEAEAKELERRAKRYWTLRYLEQHQLDRPLQAIAVRDGVSAELSAFVVRGTLRGAPAAIGEVPILVRVARVDPLRGWLAFDYLGLDSAHAAHPDSSQPPVHPGGHLTAAR